MVGLADIFWQKAKMVMAALSLMTVFVTIWSGIAFLLGAEVKEVTGSIPVSGFGNHLDYGSPAIWTISGILALGITTIVSVLLVKFLRNKKSS